MKVGLVGTVACGLGLSINACAPAVGSDYEAGHYVAPSHWSNFDPSLLALPQSSTEPLAAPDAAAAVSDSSSATAPSDPPPAGDGLFGILPEAIPLPSWGFGEPGAVIEGSPLGMPQQSYGMIADCLNTLPLPHEVAFDATTYLPQPEFPSSAAIDHDGQGQSDCVAGDCGGRPELFPCFAGAELLFWSLANSGDQPLLLDTTLPTATRLSTRGVDPGSSLGYDLFVGGYLAEGRHAISLGYLHFDPSGQRVGVTAMTAGDFFVSIAALENIGYYDNADALDSAFHALLGPPPTAGILNQMTAYRVGRDLGFHGAELNFWCFGRDGARRLGSAPGSGLCSGLGHLHSCHSDYTFGGFDGSLEQTASSGQLELLHGFRWLQVRDDFLFSAAGHQPSNGEPAREDQSYSSRIRNDLLGYQLGGCWNYAATRRLNLGVQAKLGIYANRLQIHQRVGEDGLTAQYRSDTTVAHRRDAQDAGRSTVLAGLGEIRLGGGLRLTDAWTVRGGYRLLNVAGIATTPGLLNQQRYSPNLSPRAFANDHLILDGVYVGSEYNW